MWRKTGFRLSNFLLPPALQKSKPDRLKPVLLCECQTVDGFCDYIFLDLDQVRIRPSHSQQGEGVGALKERHEGNGPISPIGRSPRVLLDAGKTRHRQMAAGNEAVTF